MNIDTYLSDPAHYSRHLLQLAEEWCCSQGMVGEYGMVIIKDGVVLGWDTYRDDAQFQLVHDHWPVGSFAVFERGFIGILGVGRNGDPRLDQRSIRPLPVSMECASQETKVHLQQVFPLYKRHLLQAIRIKFYESQEFLVLFTDDLYVECVREVSGMHGPNGSAVYRFVEDNIAFSEVQEELNLDRYDFDCFVIAAAQSFYRERGWLDDLLNRHRPRYLAVLRDSAQRLWRRLKHRVILKRFSKEVCPAHIGNVEP